MWERIGDCDQRLICLILSNLVDLGLQILDDFTGHLVAEDLEQIDALVAGNRLVGAQLNALLHILDLGVFGDQVRVLGLADGLICELCSLALGKRHRHSNHRHH